MAQNRGVKPLTRINEQTGRPFERRPEVEGKIAVALSLDKAALVERIRIRDRSSSEFLEEECLVYLLREYNIDEANRWLISDIFEEIRLRTEKFLRFELRSLYAERMEDAWQDVMDVTFSKITALDDIGDFAQVNFRSFLAAKVSDVRRRYQKQQNRDKLNAAPAWVYGSEPSGDLEPQDKHPEPAISQDLGEDLMNRELLDALSPDDRRLVELRLLGLKIEDKDPNVPTISKYFGVSPRTINNRLRALQQFALEWLEKERGR